MSSRPSHLGHPASGVVLADRAGRGDGGCTVPAWSPPGRRGQPVLRRISRSGCNRPTPAGRRD